MTRLKNTFPKKSRLKSRKKLEELFASGKRFFSGPVKLLYLEEPAEKPELKCGVGLNGRYFKKAVDRNRIKRLLREAYRLQQQPLHSFTEQTQTSISLFLLYTGKELPVYNDIYVHVGKLLHKFVNTAHEEVAS